MCCNNTILRVFNFLSLFISIALGVAAAILSAFFIITPLTAAITSAVYFLIALAVGLIGIVALFLLLINQCAFNIIAIYFFIRYPTCDKYTHFGTTLRNAKHRFKGII